MNGEYELWMVAVSEAVRLLSTFLDCCDTATEWTFASIVGPFVFARILSAPFPVHWDWTAAVVGVEVRNQLNWRVTYSSCENWLLPELNKM